MKAPDIRNFKRSAIGVVGIALAIAVAGAAIAQDSKPAPDLELDFNFLRLGLTRRAVIDMLGTPDAQAQSRTLAIKYHKLMWTGPEGKKFVAAFIHDRLWRWKTCSASVADC